MRSSTSQNITIALFVSLFFVLYFGCEKTSQEIRDLEKSRTVQPTYLSIDQEIQKLSSMISANDRAEIQSHLLDLEQANTEESKVEPLKKLAGKWYGLGQAIISGHYAEQIAEIENTEDAWSIAGTTHYLGLTNGETDNHKKHARQKALEAFEKAISIDPSNVDNKINSALCYVEFPEENQPMKGIMMLLDLDKTNPDNISVQMQLGRLSIRTNQWEKALTRFKKVLLLDPENKEVHCFLAEVYNAKDDQVKAENSAKICQTR